jgi:uncharacterized circularly permuted ATP-grasp superfamily protein
MRTASNEVRPLYQPFEQWLGNVTHAQLTQKSREAELLFRRVGITFNVYGDDAGAERLIPFDVIPRILAAHEWQRLSDGAIQRVKALNAFLNDLYHGQEIIKAGILPASILQNEMYRPEMQGVDVPGGVYAHIAGIDIVRTGENQFYVLEDNLRTPSGVSYMLEDRKMMMRLFPELFARQAVAPVEHYPDVLLENLRSVAPAGVTDPVIGYSLVWTISTSLLARRATFAGTDPSSRPAIVLRPTLPTTRTSAPTSLTRASRASTGAPSIARSSTAVAPAAVARSRASWSSS